MVQHVVLGAGPLGVSVADRLAAEGTEVRLFSVMGNPAYDMLGTQPPRIDGTDTEQLGRACHGADVVYLCLNAHYVDWYELFPPRLEATLEVAKRLGARLVYHDNVYGYEIGSGVLTEDTPQASSTRKGRLRADMASAVLDAARSGRVDCIIGRSADMYGPGALNSSFNSTLGQRHFYPLLAGKTVSIVGDIDAPHTYAFVDDVATGLAMLATNDDASGQVWHIPAAPTLSHRELMAIAFDEAGLPLKIRGSKISGYFLRAIGLFQKDVGEVSELLYQFEKPLIVSHEKYERTFGANPTPHDVALRHTLAWYQANPLA